MSLNANTGQSNGLTMDVQSLQNLKSAAGRDPKQAIHETAKQLEGIFMQELMKTMRASTMKSGMFKDATAEMGTNMLDTELANKLTGMPRGLGELIAKQLERQMGAKAAQAAQANANPAAAAGTTNAQANLGTVPAASHTSLAGLALRAATQSQSLAMLDASASTNASTSADMGASTDAIAATAAGAGGATPPSALTASDSSAAATAAWRFGAAQAAYRAISDPNAPAASVITNNASAATAITPPTNDTPWATAGAAGAASALSGGMSTTLTPSTRAASMMGSAMGGGHTQAERFIRLHQADAMAAQAATGIPASNILGQAALESGWGRHEIHLHDGTPSHNLFGIKATADWKGKVAEVTTTEYSNGVAHRVTARFRAYDSYADAFKDHARLLSQNPRYSQTVAKADTAQGFASGLQRAGYATDPAYASKLTKAIHTALRLQRGQA